MQLVTLSGVGKGYGATVVLHDVSFVVQEGDHLGLVGINGVGKSTLLRLLAGELTPDEGEIAIPRRIEIGYLPQEARFRPEQTLEGLVRESQGRVATVGQRLAELESALGDVVPAARTTRVTTPAGANGAPETAAGPESSEALLAEYGDLADQFERLGGYDLDHRIDAVFQGLSIGHLERDRQVAGLSGGEKARAALAALLLQAPDLLLLDEPTNHLDFRALAWLEGFLRSQRGTFVVVSHDRTFLNRCVTTIVEVDEHLRDARVYAGGYDAYLEAKRQERRQWQALYEREQAEMKFLQQAVDGGARRVGHPNRLPPDKDKFAKTFFGENVQRAVSRNVRAAQEKLRRLEEDPIMKPPQPLRLQADFDPLVVPVPAHLVAEGVAKGVVDQREDLGTAAPARLVAEGIVKAYGTQRVLDGVSLVLGPTSRVIITGANGAGKSTLLRILAGHEPPDSGTISLSGSPSGEGLSAGASSATLTGDAYPAYPSSNVLSSEGHSAGAYRGIGYLDQEGQDIDPDATVFSAYRQGLLGEVDALRADLVRYGFFRPDDVGKRVGDLSAGQRRKLQIARLVATRAAILVLDEPTNHLDFTTLEGFEAALLEFPGPVLAVSHDRRFIDRFAGEVWDLAHGRLTRSPLAPVRPR
ncbi:MAG: ATP-binding cassette domain-containing protein [Chloroflexota bacterium]|nr:ATP-binding cassette domain-containing protein [Chloroflexota bacterium]